ncbi:hypothetical protein MSG28_015437 [Choristoneura fumiferana]|uniref:Uncharacterized protein n=1 Tax=Choristoneura fumiferana TaxID=7141 RepID=A0ACC0KAW5_CHOFU|nr:hypothetical protein MSG28_015437 [Choristoneura fumiferana]
MVQRTNSTSEAMSDWGSANSVQFSAAKTLACLFTAKRRPFTLAPTVHRRVSLPTKDHLEVLGLDLQPSLNFDAAIESRAKTAAKKLTVLYKVKRLNPFEIYNKELTVIGVKINPFTFPKAIRWLKAMGERYLNYENLGIKTYKLSEYQQALNDLKNGVISKALFKLVK